MTDLTAVERRELELYLAQKLEPKEGLPDPKSLYPWKLSDSRLWIVLPIYGEDNVWGPTTMSIEDNSARAVVDAMVKGGHEYKEHTDNVYDSIDYLITFGKWIDGDWITLGVEGLPDYPLAVCLAAKAALESEAEE